LDLSKCQCEKAGFCPVFCRSMDAKNHEWCKKTNTQKRQRYEASNNGNDLQTRYIDLVKKSYHLPPVYRIPKNIEEVEIVTFHFNTSGSKRLQETYAEWIESLGNLGKYVKCYEIVFDDRDREIKNSILIRGSLEKHCLWQKESLLNLAFCNISTNKKYFAWIDHDLPFSNQNWLIESIQKLESGNDLVQLFEEVVYLDQKAIVSHRSVGRSKKMKNLNVKFQSRNAHGCPGGGWMGRVETLKNIFPVPSIVIGSGDEWLAYGFYGTKNISKPMQDQLDVYSLDVQDSLMCYLDKISNMKLNIGFTSGKCYHLWHGDPKNRQYTTRHQVLGKYNFHPDTDTFVNKDGILELSGTKPGIEKDILRYFTERKEDG